MNSLHELFFFFLGKHHDAGHKGRQDNIPRKETHGGRKAKGKKVC